MLSNYDHHPYFLYILYDSKRFYSSCGPQARQLMICNNSWNPPHPPPCFSIFNAMFSFVIILLLYIMLA